MDVKNSTRSLRQMLCGSRIKIWNLASHMKKWSKEHQTLSFQGVFLVNKSSILMLFVLFFHVVCKILNLNKWTEKHLAQASCTELTLIKLTFLVGNGAKIRIIIRICNVSCDGFWRLECIQSKNRLLTHNELPVSVFWLRKSVSCA
jgi:hypothetical protein